MTIQHSSPGAASIKGLARLRGADDLECFAAHLMLSKLFCHLRLAQEARAQLSCALEVLERRAGGMQTMRSAGTCMLMRVQTRADGDCARLALPCIGGEVVLPRIGVSAILPALRDPSLRGTMAELNDIALDYFRLRVRLSRVRAALRPLVEQDCLEDVAAALGTVLDQCIIVVAPATPLQMADGYFMLARHFTRAGHRDLARLALQKARDQVDAYAGVAGIASHGPRAQVVLRNIDSLMQEKGSLLF